jgi:hypothetical protein
MFEDGKIQYFDNSPSKLFQKFSHLDVKSYLENAEKQLNHIKYIITKNTQTLEKDYNIMVTNFVKNREILRNNCLNILLATTDQKLEVAKNYQELMSKINNSGYD